MSDFIIRDASRQKAKIRLGISSVSGGGKTYSALNIAYGLCGDWSKVVIIDTENNSGDFYAHLGPYKVLSLPAPYSPERYIECIKACENSGAQVIIIDSISHEWEGEGGIINLVESIGGGFQNAWKKLTPRHEAFKQKIVTSSCHVITTSRRKQDYVLQEETNSTGKRITKPVKVGLKEVTREGWEYELMVNLELDLNHYATTSKDRTELFMDKDPFVPSAETGKLIRQWCDTGLTADQMLQMNKKAALEELSSCASIDALGEAWKKYKQFQADKDFSELKDMMKQKLL